MVHHVVKIIVENELQRQRRRIGDHASPRPCRFRHCFGGGQQLAIESHPSRNQRRPVPILIAMQCYPLVAVVFGHSWIVLQLSANNSLVIIGGGVQQMPEFFLERPLRGRRFALDLIVGQICQASGQLIDERTQPQRALHSDTPTTVIMPYRHGSRNGCLAMLRSLISAVRPGPAPVPPYPSAELPDGSGDSAWA